VNIAIYILLGLFAGLWFIGFIILNDFSVSTISTKEFKNVLVIYPHPDDESLTVSGLLSQLSHQKVKTNLLILTKGGGGESGPYAVQDLKKIRAEEIKKSASIIGITNLVQADFEDGHIKEYEDEVTKYVDSQIVEIKPDLVITYDLAGLYGHEDHMTTSSIVTKLIKDKYPNVSLWYTSLPLKVLKLATLPTQMAKDKDFASKRSTPNLRIYIGLNVINRIRSVYAHRSQYDSFRKGVPKILPLWFVYSMQPFEYFAKVN
jgi:LmbE family N-acetylglucosaminyl deacetylase